MRHRHDRDVDAGQRADLPRVHAAGVDDHLGLDVTMVGLDRLDSPAPDADPGHARVLLDLGAAPARALGQGERQLAGIDVTVGRQIGSAEHTVGLHRRKELRSPRPLR